MVSPILQAVSVATGELRDIQYWNPISGKYESTPPTFTVGHWGGLACRGVNLTGSTQEMYMTFSVIDPRGYLIDTWGTDIHIVPSGGGFSANYGVYCDIVGDYTMQCHLAIAEIGYVDSIWETICHVTEAEVEAFIDTWWLWDDEERDWVRPSPTLIPFGSDIGIRGRAWNKSDSAINMRMDAVTHSPSGKTRTITGDIKEVPAGLYPAQYPCWDFLWESDEWGDWEADLILYAALPGETLVEVDRRENIAVAAVQEMAVLFQGTISKTELEYDGSRANIPAADIPLGKRGLVHIWGRNDVSTNQKMGISWVVKDPDGVVVEEYSHWETFWTSPGNEHHFIGDRFDLNKEGTYTLKVDLLMDPDDPVIVDTYSGILCTVVAPVLAGTITRVVLEYDQAEGDAPVLDIPLGQRGLVHVWGRNDTIESQIMGISWVVKDPNGNMVEQYSDWQVGMTNPGAEHHFIGDRFNLDKVGSYTISTELLMIPEFAEMSPVVDTYEGVLCVVGEEIPPTYELIYQHEYPLGKTYVGKAEECTASLRVNLPDQLFPNSWVVNKIINTFEEKVGEHGAQMLDVKIYEDATPTWHTDYRIVATATASPIPWAVIIPLVLAIILVIAFTNLVVKVKDIDWGEIPPEISWLPLALIGGLVVLGGGAAVALAARPKE